MCLNTAFVSCAIKKLCSVKVFYFFGQHKKKIPVADVSAHTNTQKIYTEKGAATGYVGGFEINNNL